MARLVLATALILAALAAALIAQATTLAGGWATVGLSSLPDGARPGEEWVVVGSGPNGASPHHELSDRVIEPGDPVVVDIGGTTAEGYCSDSTRTYLAGGAPEPELAACHEVVAAAQEAAVRAVRPGVTAQAVDAAARDLITAAGYGEAFVHRTGHGIGLETHEDPYVVAGNTMPLEPGMAFSIEPGIYLPGRHGVRIEDIVVVTPGGVERLNHRPRNLIAL